jgi:hypothetical protein
MLNEKGEEIKFQSKDWSELLKNTEFKEYTYQLICDKIILKYDDNFGIDDIITEEIKDE